MKKTNHNKTISSSSFGELVQKHTDKLLEGLSIRKIASLDHIDLNKQAILLAQKELRSEYHPSLSEGDVRGIEHA